MNRTLAYAMTAAALLFVATVASCSSAQADYLAVNCYRGNCIVSHVRTTPVIQHVAPAEITPESADREAKWELECKPTIKVDALGVGRYVYARPGCENGVAR